MTEIWTGTAAVENGETLVTVAVGDALSDANCSGGSLVLLAGASYFIDHRINTLSFHLTRAYDGVDGTVPMEISPISKTTASLVQLASVVARVQAQINVFDKNSQGLFFVRLGVTGNADPGPGNLAFDNADPALVTAVFIDNLDANDAHHDVSPLLSRFGVGTTIRLRSLASTAYAEYDASGTAFDETGYIRLTLTYVGHSGVIGDGEPCALSWTQSGEGLTVRAGGALAGRAAFDDEPGGFTYLSNNGDGASLTGSVLFIKNSGAAADWSPGFPLTGPRGYRGWAPRLAVVNDGTRRVLKLDGYVGGEGDPPTVGLGFYLSAGGLTNDIALAMNVRGEAGISAYQVAVAAGFAGDAAAWLLSLVGKSAYQVAVAAGFAGDVTAWLASLRGADGSDPGVLLTWSASTADANAGAGRIWANNALDTATQIYVSKTNRAGSNIETFLNALGASTNDRKGTITLTRAADDVQVVVDLASVTNAAGYVKLTLVPESHAGVSSFLAGNAISFQFARSGNAGAADLAGVTSAVVSAPNKASPVSTDKTFLLDSEASDAGKTAQLGALRSAIGVPGHTESVKTDSYTITPADIGKVMVANKATAMTFSLDAAATFTGGFLVKNIGAGVLTIDPNAAETVDGAATITVAQNESLFLISNGTAWRSLFKSAPASASSSLDLTVSMLAIQAADAANVAMFGPNWVADSFDTLTYVDVAGATGLDISTSGVLKPIAIGRISGGTPTSTFSGTPANFNDNNPATVHTTSGLGTLTGATLTNRRICSLEFATAQTIVKLEAIGHRLSSGTGTHQFYTSLDGTTWTAFGASFLANVTPTDYEATGSVSAKYVALMAQNGTYGAITATVADFNAYLTAVQNMTVRSAAFTASAVPSKMKALLHVVEVDAAVAGTDYTLEFSRDNRTTWTAAALTELFTSPSPVAGVRVVEAAETSVAGQPSGSQVAWRFKNLGNKNVWLDAVKLDWAA